jgi:hypothetical protein
MTNYRISQYDVISSGSATYTINNVVGTPITGSSGNTLDRVWGVMKEHDNSTATITLSGGGSLAGSHMITGQIYPCYPISIKVSSGSFGLLS